MRLDNAIIPKDQEVDFRGHIEDRINDKLQEHKMGHSFDGGQGRDFAYIDFILFGGQESINLVLQEMKAAGLPGGSTVHYWAGNKKKVYTI